MVRIFVDSAADFEPNELENMDVACIPISVYFGDKEYRENENLSKQMFYKLIETEKDFPNTSQPSPHAFESVLKKVKNSGDEAVVITVSSALSGTYQGAVLAKNMLEYENCYVIDSLTASCGERILTEQAVRLRDAGKSAGEIAENLEKLRSRIVLYACIDTLEYLYKGGRISHSAYAIGSVAHIKPILRLSHSGGAEISAKALGIKRGIDYICKMIKKVPCDCNFPIYVMYTYNQKNGQALAQYLKRYGIDIPDSHIINVGAAIGSHIGLNACGIAYVKT